MTLIEIMLALAIVSLLAYAAAPSIEAMVGIKAREESGKIAGAIRYMYGHSAITGKVCRLVFNLDDRQYWPECTEGRFTVEREKEQSRNGARVEDKKKFKKENKVVSSSRSLDSRDEMEAMKKKIEDKAEFSEFGNEAVPKRNLPDGANLAVWTAHQREKYTKGTAFLYFFPQGYTERAQLYISSDRADVYTVQVFPLTGRVKVHDKELDVPRD